MKLVFSGRGILELNIMRAKDLVPMDSNGMVVDLIAKYCCYCDFTRTVRRNSVTFTL